LLLDGLAAEREQAITIDVAYRYFETRHRKFIIADCPGHEQYTRNTVTGASTADCAVMLIDARKGVTTQSRRHGFILSLLQVPHVVVVVNKMDIVDYVEEAYLRIVRDYSDYARRLEFRSLTFLPVSALKGDNVSARTNHMPWYQGPTLLQYLESLLANPNRNAIDFRFPVQCVIRPNSGFRGFAGRIVSGTIRAGEEIAVLPSRRKSTVKSIETFEGPIPEASAPLSVVLTLADEVDTSRGCMLVRPRNIPMIDHCLDATICWMHDAPLELGTPYWLKHTTQTVKAFVSKLIYRFDVDTLHRQAADDLRLNDIGRVEIQTTLPLYFDPYKLNQATGSFILIDSGSSHTVAAGIIRGKPSRLDEMQDGAHGRKCSTHTLPHEPNISREKREARNGHKACVLWLTGLSGAGKSTIGRRLEQAIHELGCATMLLDGDQLRQGLCGDLGFSGEDRTENIRRAGEVAGLFFESGHIVICTFISPNAKDRAVVRALVPEGRFVEIHVDCPVEVCIERDPNGLYRNALKGEIKDFTGVSANYEPPTAPEIRVRTDHESPDQVVEVVMRRLVEMAIISVCAQANDRPRDGS
jgi:bifunctional enzyme CysN/CysC